MGGVIDMRKTLLENNYLLVPNFISLEDARFLNGAFKEHVLTNNLKGDVKVPSSPSMYNFLPFVRLLINKIPEVQRLLQEDVLPTYTYARVYKNNSVLERHFDRFAGEISITLNLAKDSDWPIYFQRADGSEVAVEMEVGDAVLYLGFAEHWRNVFTGNECTQVFMHYVRSFGPNSWAFFDRQTIPPEQKQVVAAKSLDVNAEWQVTVL
jgi:hypothetical protein